MSDAKPFSDKQIDSINELLKTNNHYRFEYYLLEDDGKRETRINADTDTVRRFLATIAADRIELNAWKTAFGNQQLTHAIAQRDADRKRILELENYNEVLKGLRAEEAEDYESLQKRLECMKRALETIAAFNDEFANMRLEKTGSYGGFDEPGSVSTARQALKEKPEGEE